ncbi:MAG: MFS transporter, partial [Halomonas venusta]|nr:MFS transporter [Halomonas venusta]
ITRPDLWRLDLSIFSLHLVLMAIFVAVPFRLLNAGVAIEYHGLAYLAIMALSFIAMVPLVIVAEKYQRMKLICLLAIGAIVISLGSLGLPFSQESWLFAWLFVFFTGFNLLEATLPSMLSKLAPAGAKGTAMGVYSTSQFLGAFLGGTLGGLLSNLWGLDAVFFGCAGLALLWWLAMWRMPSPPPLSSEVVALHDTQPDALNLLMEHLADVVGVEDVMVVPEERLMYLKVNRKELDQAALSRLLSPPKT